VQSLIRSADVVGLVVDLGSDDGGQQAAEVISKVQQTKTRLARSTHLDPDDIGTSYTTGLLVFNKVDLPEALDRKEFFRDYLEVDWEEFLVSAKAKTGLDELARRTFELLDVVRVYTKTPSKKTADLEKPYTLPRGAALLDLARLIHNDLAESLKSARVWGSAVHDGTVVKGDYVLHDKDVVEIHA
jgi:ribosome-interacting GTPase 1